MAYKRSALILDISSKQNSIMKSNATFVVLQTEINAKKMRNAAACLLPTAKRALFVVRFVGAIETARNMRAGAH